MFFNIERRCFLATVLEISEASLFKLPPKIKSSSTKITFAPDNPAK